MVGLCGPVLHTTAHCYNRRRSSSAWSLAYPHVLSLTPCPLGVFPAVTFTGRTARHARQPALPLCAGKP